MEIKENRIIGVVALNDRPSRQTLVVTPTYNERDNIAAFIEAVGCADADLMIVDDNSPDGTADLVMTEGKNAAMRVWLMRRKNKAGLGTAYLDAYRWLIETGHPYEVIVQMDADFSHEPSFIPILAAAGKKSGVAIGSRYVPGGAHPEWPLRRQLLSFCANLYARAALALRFGKFGVRDSTAGFVAWRSDALKKVFSEEIKSNGYAFQIETKFRATRLGYRPVELPITFRDRSRGVSKISRRIILEALLLPWRISTDAAANGLGAPATCPVCNDRPMRYAEKNGYVFWRSRTCGLLFVWPYLSKPPQEIYQSEYFSGASSGFGYVDYDAEKTMLRGFFKKIIKRLERHASGKGALLDVGAATGSFVELAQKEGWNARGIDISAHSVSAANAKGLPLEQATLDDFTSPAESFAVITMWDVLEHLPDPFSALQKSWNLLKRGGILAVNTPDAGSFWARLFGKRWHSLIPPEHIFIFNRNALERVLEKNGFEIVEVKKPVKVFTMPYIFSTFSRWLGITMPTGIMNVLRKKPFSSIGLPLPLRDNVLILARKT